MLWILVFATLNAQAAHVKCTLQLKRGEYVLMNGQGEFYKSEKPGSLGGYWRGRVKIYGRLDCPGARSWIARGHYVNWRVFFATEEDALAAGFRPCKRCMRE